MTLINYVSEPLADVQKTRLFTSERKSGVLQPPTSAEMLLLCLCVLAVWGGEGGEGERFAWGAVPGRARRPHPS